MTRKDKNIDICEPPASHQEAAKELKIQSFSYKNKFNARVRVLEKVFDDYF
jgi:hypothetical protein